MSQLTAIILKSGILSTSAIEELRRWGMPVGESPPAQAEYAAELSPEILAKAISEAIEGEGYLVVRETDLEALPQFLGTMRSATLHAVVEGEGHDIPVQVGNALNGSWLMPWVSESITDLLTNGETYLRVDGKRLFFTSATELFYGEHKAFIACRVGTEEADDS